MTAQRCDCAVRCIVGCSSGQFDAQDGPGSVEAWTVNLDWPGKREFFRAKRHIWRLGQDTSEFLQDADSDTDSYADSDEDSEPRPSVGWSDPVALASDVRLQLPQLADASGVKSGSKVQPVAGFWKHHQSLTTVVLKDAGHMVPRDQPVATQHMIEAWVQHCVGHRWNTSMSYEPI